MSNEIAIWRRRAELGLPSDAKTGAKSCVERTRRPRPCRDPMGAATRAELAWNSLFKNNAGHLSMCLVCRSAFPVIVTHLDLHRTWVTSLRAPR